ncbi:sensor histidine kinase [Haloferula sargassicola]|uniref:Uncharacterized protein n=1 Tax=Haloferula sargassicola TaxID=490096 RepID=A0ABP9URE6_9BACT
MKPLILIAAGLLAPAAAQDPWGERLASVFSSRLGEIRQEVARLEAATEGLPRVPIDDQGGSGGFATQHPRELPDDQDRHAVEIRWGSLAAVDEVVLVPARRYDAQGLEPQFGMPDSVRVVGLGDDGNEQLLGECSGLWAEPVRAGHPIRFTLLQPVPASGVRIEAGRLPADPDEGSKFILAWSECLVFAEGRNVASNAKVTALAGITPPAPWQWSPAFLVDGQTPLGLPEGDDEGHVNVGWLSKALPSAEASVELEIDLGRPVTIDHLRLFPAKRPTPDLPSGFGFPQQLEVTLARDRGSLGRVDGETFDIRNPGHNPVVLKAAGDGVRFVRLRATRLWKPFDNYPAFCAFSEIEVLDDTTNVALGARIRSADGMGNVVAPGGRYWSSQSLTDGFGPEGRIIPVQQWLDRLDQRRDLELQAYRLGEEARGIVRRWRNLGLWTVVLASAVGALLLVVLPIRFRIREKKKLLEVRERIAGDLHDEVGSNLGSIQMFADLAETRGGATDELKRIQRIASETVSAVRDIVWLLRPGGAHRIGTVEHLRETASIMLERLDWHFTADEAAWEVELSDDANRHLFLYFREALHNILRHANAAQVWINISDGNGRLNLTITDDGVGIPVEKRERPATLRALRQRSESLGGSFIFECGEDGGTTLRLGFPLTPKPR